MKWISSRTLFCLALGLLCVSMVPRETAAQLAPTGEHYAGRPSDTGYGGTIVNATGTFAAAIPLDLPPARGGLPIPLQITYGGRGVGAAGLGWDLPLSYIQQDRTLAHRRPALNPGALPQGRERTYLSLFGQTMELVLDGGVWVARSGTLELTVREIAGSWLAYDGKGRMYAFIRPANLGSTGLWLLKSVSVAGESSIELTYHITTWPLDGGVGTAIDLVRLTYNTDPNYRPINDTPGDCAKNEIALTYGNGSIPPVSLSMLGDKVLVRKNTLTLVEVSSRASCGTPFERLRRYELQYLPDTDTQLPRLRTVRMFGRDGTPEANTALPIASYNYGSATQDGTLRYQKTQPIDLPTGIQYDQISGTNWYFSLDDVFDTRHHYAMWQTLTDVNGDGRPDLVFQRDDKLWVAKNSPALDGKTTLGVGPVAPIVQLSDATLATGGFSTHTTTQRRFWYGAANRNTVDVWRQAIDVNGDGRIDIVDAAEEANHWVIYLNTPSRGPTGFQWERRSFSVARLREKELAHHVFDNDHVPLSRRATGRTVDVKACWKFDSDSMHWQRQLTDPRCPDAWEIVAPPPVCVNSYDFGQPPLCAPSSPEPEQTFVEWELNDLNGDGYPDLVFNSDPVDLNPTAPDLPPQVSERGIRFFQDGQRAPFGPPPTTNVVRASFNVRGVRFDTTDDHDPFAMSVNLSVPGGSSQNGVSAWSCTTPSPGDKCENYQREFAGFADVNGDGLADRVVGVGAYLGAYNGTATMFSDVYITLPGPLATQLNTFKEQCLNPIDGRQKPETDQIQGLRDLTGDGIPDYTAHDSSRGWQVWIGTGTGFREPISITVNGARFRFSHQNERCDGRVSNTDGGLFDIDGDGKPEVIGLDGETLVVSQLAGGQASGIPEAGRLTELDNGYGAKTSITYVSAKQFTDNAVPFPEIVVGSVATTGTQSLGGTLGKTFYAYGNAELVFDSVRDRFAFSGYRRTVEFRHTLPQADKADGPITITDTWTNTPFSPSMTEPQRWLSMQRVGRARDIFTLRGSVTADPWTMILTFDGSDPSIIGVTHYEWDAKRYKAPPGEEVGLDCLEMVQPLDLQLSLRFGTIDVCRAHGFAFGASRDSWSGAAPPPADNNVQTRSQALQVDDFGRPILIQYDNDLFRSDDDICIENTFAAPTGGFPRVLTALASRQIYTGSINQLVYIPCVPGGTPFASESWAYDGLPAGAVSNGRMTSHSIDRRATDTGELLNTVRRFDATYDDAGNLTTVRTQREGSTRTITFGYDAFGLVPIHTTVDATGVPSIDLVIDYDPVSRQPLSSTDANQMKRSIDVDGFGRPIRLTVTPPGGPLGVISTASYLGFTSTEPDGRRVTATRFSDPVAPANVPTAVGRTGTVFLDELGRKRRTELALGSDYANDVLVVGSRVYDDAGRVVFEADPYPKSQNPATPYGTSYAFKNTGDLACIIRGRGPQPRCTEIDVETERFPTSFERSFIGHAEMLDVSDAASLQAGSPQADVVKRVVSTAIGRLIERSTLRAGLRLEHATFSYDRLGQQTSMTRFLNPASATKPVQWSWQLDSMGHTLRLVEPETATRTYSYSDWGEKVETQWADGAVDRRLVSRYDALGRLTATEERNDGVTDAETVNTYTYDVGVNVSPLVTPTFVLGQLARASSPSGQVAFSYDVFGRVNAQVFTDNQGGLYIEKAEHHADGHLRALEFNLPDQHYDKELVTYAYDSAGRRRAVSYADGSKARELYRAEDVDPFGRVRKALIGGHTVFHAKYADDGRRLMKEAAVESTLGSRQVIFERFDPIGRELSRREITDGAAPGPRTNVAYDALGRLGTAVKTNGTTPVSQWGYSYDPLGNLRNLVDDLGSDGAELSYHTEDHDRLCRIDYGGLGAQACNVFYDAVGNIVEQATRTGLRHVRYFASGKVRDITESPAHAFTEGPAQATFRYDAFGSVQELDLTGVGVKDTRHDRRYGGLIERRDQVINGTTTTFISRKIPGLGGIVASRRGTGDEWVFGFGELRGNRFFTDQDGKFIQDVKYQPFGEASSSGAPPGSAQYTSMQWNGEDALVTFGLSQLGARLYDPVIGRFLSRDPLLIPRTATTSNPYAFAMNDPVNGADPSGLDCIGPEDCQPLDPLGPDNFIMIEVGSGGSGSPAAVKPPAPSVSAGPQTPEGVLLRAQSLALFGYAPSGLKFDTLANTSASMSSKLDSIAQYISVETDADVDEYNDRLEGWGSYWAGFGDSVWFWCPGCGAAARQTYGITTGDGDRWAYFWGSMTGMGGSIAATLFTSVVTQLELRANAAAGGIQYGPAGDEFLVNASRATPVPGVLDVAVHGSPLSVNIGGSWASHRVLASLIESNPQFTGQPIRLLSCYTGCLANGFAQNLANKLGVLVYAPNELIWATPGGRLTIGPWPTLDTGAFLPFFPSGGSQ